MAVNSSLKLMHYLSNVHTWALFFLRQLANMSSMVPFWASTDSSFVPNLGPAFEATPSRGGCIVLMTADHISPNIFSIRNFLSNVRILFLIIHSTSFILIIHHMRTSNYIFLFTWQVHSFISSFLHSRPAVIWSFRRK